MYAPMFKASPNCRPPHVNVDTLRDELHRGRAVQRTGAKSADELLQWLLRENERLRGRAEGGGWAGKGERALAKAVEHRFFLGMESTWIAEGALLVRHGADAESKADDE